MEVKRKRKRTEAENQRSNTNWLEYYESIRNVCPWSYRSYVMGGIITVPYTENTFSTFAKCFENSIDEHGQATDCIVYVCTGKSLDWLEHMVDTMNNTYPHQEWLYSSPADDDGNATPVEVLIQQRSSKLEELREKVGYYDEED